MAARVKSKATAIKLSIATVFTTIAAVKSLKSQKPKVQTYDSTALDSGVGMEKSVTGYVDSGSVTGTLWYDTSTATHKALLGKITTPTEDDSWKLVFADSGEWAFTGILTEFGDVKVEMNSGITADFTVETDGVITFPS